MSVALVAMTAALVDVSAVSLAELRTSVDPELRRSEARIMDDASNAWVAVLKTQSASGGNGC